MEDVFNDVFSETFSTRDPVTVNLIVNKVFIKDYFGLVKHGRDPLTEGLWWQLSMKWRHDQCKDIMPQTPDIFSLVDATWKHP